MRVVDVAILSVVPLFGSGLLGGCAGSGMPASQYPPGYHVGGIDEGALIGTGQLAITRAPDGTIVPKAAMKTAGTEDPPALAGMVRANASRASPAPAGFAVASHTASVAVAAHAPGAHAAGARSGGGASGGHGGGGGSGGGGGAGGGGGGGH
jgi:uncharacterized membrane protein YgcG